MIFPIIDAPQRLVAWAIPVTKASKSTIHVRWRSGSATANAAVIPRVSEAPAANMPIPDGRPIAVVAAAEVSVNARSPALDNRLMYVPFAGLNHRRSLST
jgi:hypothetical protein